MIFFSVIPFELFLPELYGESIYRKNAITQAAPIINKSEVMSFSYEFKASIKVSECIPPN